MESELLYTKKSNIKGAGIGVFAKVDISKNQIVGEYTGYKKRTSQLTKLEERYALGINKTHSVVGTGITSKINDIVDFRKLTGDEMINYDYNKVFPTVKKLSYNCEFVEGPTKNKTYVIAISDIKKNAELYVDYSTEYWSNQYYYQDYYTTYTKAECDIFLKKHENKEIRKKAKKRFRIRI